MNKITNRHGSPTNTHTHTHRYMWCKDEILIDMLRPKLSFQDLEKAISSDQDALAKCDTVLDLLGSGGDDLQFHKLRILDMLFCEHEGDGDELWRRLTVLHDKFLGPMIVRCSGEPAIDKNQAALTRYVGAAFANVCDLWSKKETREKELENAKEEAERQTKPWWGRLDKWKKETWAPNVSKATAELEGLYGTEYEQLQSSPISKELFALPKKRSFLPPLDINNGRFVKGPKFAYSLDLKDAANELQSVGVIDSPAALCSLIAVGRHPLINGGKGSSMFNNSEQYEFWWALVLLWQIGLHKQVEKEFNEAMQGLAKDNNVECRVAPIKGFERALEKAKEYADEKQLQGRDHLTIMQLKIGDLGFDYDVAERIQAPLHVVDMLRCSFTVDTVEENLAIGRALESKFAVVRTKNNHQPGHLGYADRNYNIVFQSKDGNTKVVCEVQILMRRYIEVKKIGHLLYELIR